MTHTRMSENELRAVGVVEQVRSGRLTASEAAERMGVTARTVRRWKAAVEAKGAAGLAHGNRGRESSRRTPKRERDRIASLIREKYPDFGPTFAAEKLLELHGIDRHRTTVGAIMAAEGLWTPRSGNAHSAAPHRQWRERRSHRGDLVQFDGSYHDWLEGRDGTHEQCLLAAVDDASGDIRATFAPHEGIGPVMGFWTEYANARGLPKSVYLDRFSTYKMTQRAARENPDLKTQFQRAMKTLGVEPVFALSPQAKGRVERLFKTLQDRLVKEMRLRKISTAERANRFLVEEFVPAFNRKYRVEPREEADFHRMLSMRELAGLPDVLCRIERRSVMNDFTVSFEGQWYQILPTPRLAIRPKDEVLVRQYPDASIRFFIREKPVVVKPIAKRLNAQTFHASATQILVAA